MLYNTCSSKNDWFMQLQITTSFPCTEIIQSTSSTVTLERIKLIDDFLFNISIWQYFGRTRLRYGQISERGEWYCRGFRLSYYTQNKPYFYVANMLTMLQNCTRVWFGVDYSGIVENKITGK